jgi:hypothetical protein
MARPRGAVLNTDDTSSVDLGQSDFGRDQSRELSQCRGPFLSSVTRAIEDFAGGSSIPPLGLPLPAAVGPSPPRSAPRPDRSMCVRGYPIGSHSGRSSRDSCAAGDRAQGTRWRRTDRHTCRLCAADHAIDSASAGVVKAGQIRLLDRDGVVSADGRRLFRLVAYDGVEGFFTLPLSRCVGSPNSKPPLVVAGRAIIDADIRVTSSWELVQACDLHFLPAATCGQLGATGYQ